MTSPSAPLTTAIRVTRVMDRLGIVHTIGGSIAAAFAGEPRSTIAIDIVASMDEGQARALAEALAAEFYVATDTAIRAVRTRTSVNLIEQATQIKVDIFIAGGTALDLQQLERRQPVALPSGEMIHVHPPEDILLQKLRWYRLGGERSDRQWRDILGIVRVQGARLDRAYLSASAPHLDVSDLLERALAQDV